MAQHNNLYSQAGETEVYAALHRDYKRDAAQSQIISLVAVVAILWLGRAWDAADMFAAVALYWAFNAGIRTFIDNSNRNFFLHMLDWQFARRDPRQTEGLN